MTTKNKPLGQLSAIFGALDDPGHIEAVIDRALEQRGRMSEGARSRLNAAIRNSTIPLPGFRDKSKAPVVQLRAPLIVDMMKGNDKLAGAILLAWMESRRPLRKAVTQHFKGQDIATDGIDVRKGEFVSLWPRSEWEIERATIREASENFDDNDIILMMSCVSGRLPEPHVSDEQKLESKLFRGWMEELRNMDSDADDWLDLDLFQTALSELGESKATESVKTQSEAIEGDLAEVVKEYSDEFQYLGVEIPDWPGDSLRYGKASFTDAREILKKMREAANEYRPVRPQAPTREEELERASARAEKEQAILDTSERWNWFIDRLKEMAEEAEAENVTLENAVALEKYEKLKAEVDEMKSETESMRSQAEDIKVQLAKAVASAAISIDDHEELKREVETLKTDNERLRGANAGLDADREALGEQNRRMRRQLAESKQMAEMWRQSYESERAMQVQASEIDPSQLESVTQALELAEQTYPDTLLLVLNSKSDKNSPFQKPDEVFGALKWLATEYHDLRANPAGDSPDFNMLVKQACSGWSYKPGQTEVTKEQFNQWYTAWHDGKSYDLKKHLAKGTSHDPQNTIRIAFEWDDDLNKVVVGFLGLHQRNRRSA